MAQGNWHFWGLGVVEKARTSSELSASTEGVIPSRAAQIDDLSDEVATTSSLSFEELVRMTSSMISPIPDDNDRRLEVKSLRGWRWG